jgi:aspartate carbamoyltransferase catalytic subunit
MRHLIDLDELDQSEFETILDRAQSYLHPDRLPTEPRSSTVLATMFMEPSTRTRISTEIAAKQLGLTVVDLNLDSSSRRKGETDSDTLSTLAAQGVALFAVRTNDAGAPRALADGMDGDCALINCGEAHLNHPTQGLLDALTVRQSRPDHQQCRVVIVGDLAHSRVARSAVQAFRSLGVADIALAAPDGLMPSDPAFEGLARYGELDAALTDRDVVMMLRVQTERMDPSLAPDSATYHQNWGLTESRLALADPDAIVMHPGPFNRGVEIASSIVDGPRSVIWQQVKNGVAVRMAVIEHLLEALDG